MWALSHRVTASSSTRTTEAKAPSHVTRHLRWKTILLVSTLFCQFVPYMCVCGRCVRVYVPYDGEAHPAVASQVAARTKDCQGAGDSQYRVQHPADERRVHRWRGGIEGFGEEVTEEWAR